MNQKHCLKPTEMPSACSLGMKWAVIPDFPDFAISECGDVVKISANRRLRGSLDYDGYITYKITNSNGEKQHISAHRLVAFGFLTKPNSLRSQVAHINGSRLCSSYKNLRWSTSLENHEDRTDHGTGPKGQSNPKAKLSDADVIEIRRLHLAIRMGDIKMKVGDIAKSYGLNIATVSNIAHRKSWKHI